MKTLRDVECFEKLESQIHSTRREIAELSKKKPNDPLSTFKLKYLDSALANCNTLLGSDSALEGFSTFGEDQVPTNSDAVFVLAHYCDALHRYRKANTRYEGNSCYWRLSEIKESISAPNPMYEMYKE